MKLNKYIVSLSAVLAIVGAIFAFSNIASAYNPIKLTSPNSGTFAPGQTVNLTWTGGDTTAPVKISLIQMNPFKTYVTITNNASNTGSYSWTIPNTVPDNTYEFYVQSNPGKAGSTWSYGGVIKITTPSCDPTLGKYIKVTSPTNSDGLKTGDNVTIKWLNCGFTATEYPFVNWMTMQDNTHLTTNDVPMFISTQPLSQNNTGSLTVKIPNYTPDGTYHISMSVANASEPDSFQSNTPDLNSNSYPVFNIINNTNICEKTFPSLSSGIKPEFILNQNTQSGSEVDVLDFYLQASKDCTLQVTSLTAFTLNNSSITSVKLLDDNNNILASCNINYLNRCVLDFSNNPAILQPGAKKNFSILGVTNHVNINTQTHIQINITDMCNYYLCLPEIYAFDVVNNNNIYRQNSDQGVWNNFILTP